MKPMTRWIKYNPKTNIYEHNHLEDGHVQTNLPVPVSEEQKKSWNNAKWRKQFGFLDENNKFQPMRI